MEFANGPQRPAVAGFSETGRVLLNRGSSVTVGCLGPPDFPFALSVLVQPPTHGSKLGQRLGAERTPFMREGSCREAVGPPQGATLLDRGVISHE